MKKLTRTIAAVLLMGTSTAFANDMKEEKTKSFDMSMYVDQNSETLKTFYEKSQGNTLIIEIQNEKGQTLHQSIVGKKRTTAQLNFNLRNLEDGAYKLVVTDGSNTVEKPLELNTPSVERNISI